MKVTAVVPAFNEAGRVQGVLDVLAAASAVDEVLVVDDGSSDGTYLAVESHPAAQGKGAKVRCLRQVPNAGKGAAMRRGAEAALDADILLFLDADLIGLSPEHVASLAAPVTSGEYDMALGVFRGGRGATTLAQVLVPNISGQRAIRRDLFLSVPCISQSGFGVELAITNFIAGGGYRMTQVVLHGVTHPMKEEKLGLLRGVRSRARMYWQMLPYMFVRGGKPRRRPRG